MIRRLHHALPGGPAVRVIVMAVIGAAAVARLVVFSEWPGTTVLDSGGTVG